MAMMVSLPCVWVVTVCSLPAPVFRVPAAAALARSRWIDVATSACWPIIASPSFWVQSRWSLSCFRTDGKATSDLTLTSQVLSATAVTAASPLRLGLACDQRAASTISSG